LRLEERRRYCRDLNHLPEEYDRLGPVSNPLGAATSAKTLQHFHNNKTETEFAVFLAFPIQIQVGAEFLV
jgi:hypothetical protein